MPLHRQYLSPLEALSQVYLNKYTLVLVVMALKVHLFRRSVLASLDALAVQSECDKEATEYPVKVSLLIDSYVQDAVAQTAYSYLSLIQVLVSTVKYLVLFYVEVFLGTYTCLLNAAVSGTAAFAAETSVSVIKAVNGTIVGVAEEIQDGLDGLSAAIAAMESAFGKVKSFFTGVDTNSTAQDHNKIQLSITALKRVAIPASVLTSIDHFRNTSVPTFDQLQNSTSQLVSAPFDYMGSALSRSAFNSSLSQNRSLLANDTLPSLPPLECPSGVGSVVNQLHKDIDLAAKNCLLGLLVAAGAVCIPMVYGHLRAWKRQSKMSRELVAAGSSEVGLMNVLHRYSSPWLYYLHRLAHLRNTRAIWLLSYTMSPDARLVLVLGLGGVLTVLFQWTLLRVLKRAVKSHSSSLSSSYANNTADAISKSFIEQTNQYIVSQETLLNTELLGHIQKVSSSLNSTLVSFLSSMNHTLNEAFGSTPLAGPVNTVVYCTIGRKLEKIESGLTWINQNLKISLPSVDDNLRLKIKDLIQAKDLAPLAHEGLVACEKAYESTIRWELFISIGLLGLWSLQVVIGVVWLLFTYFKEKHADTTDSSIQNNFVIDPTWIGGPQPLTMQQRQTYGYPFSNPYEDTSSLDKESTPDHGKKSGDVTSSWYGSSPMEFPTRTSSTVQT